MGSEAPQDAPTLLIRFKAGSLPSNLRNAHGVELSVPQTLGRKSLRNLLHHLLDLSDGPDFHFLVGDDPLRTTIDKFLQRRNLSAEKTLELTYYIPLPKPTPNPPQTVSESWLSSIDASHSPSHGEPLVLAGAYSGIPSIHVSGNEILGEDALRDMKHAAAVKAVSWLPSARSFVTASQDQTVRLWSFDSEEKAARPVAEFRSHETDTPVSFECASVTKITSSGRTASGLGAADGSIWVVPDLMPEDGDDDEKISAGAKRKSPTLRSLSAVKVGITSTDLSVSGVKWKGDALVSAGWDSLVREWDVEKCVANISIPCGGKAVTSVSVADKVVMVSAVDGAVRLIDSREGKGVVAACGKRGAHRGIVSDACWVTQGESGVSAGLDGSLRLWDLRSMLSPAHVLDSVHGVGGKCLAVCAGRSDARRTVLSAGSDGKIASSLMT